MSSSSLYEPEEDDDTSDSDISVRNFNKASSPDLRDQPSTSQTRQHKKRTARAKALSQLHASLPGLSFEAYKRIFAEFEANSTATRTSNPDSREWDTTQQGAVIWTSREKEILLSTLDRTGRNGIRKISQAIETKSELEVQEYIRLLHRGVEHRHLRGLPIQSVTVGQIPAAVETSQEGCAMLDEYAKLLSFTEKQNEDTMGQQKHNDLWIIDRGKAQEVDEQLASLEDYPGTGSSIYHTARLLKLKHWVQLSERFFMNFGGPRLDDNWTNIAFADELPSVTADAFADFYALAVSVTRRLVHSALFFAMSRLRNMRDTGNAKAQIVRSRDVKAAINVLDMKRDRLGYWAGLARRCDLDVADIRHRSGWQPVPLNHDEVEERLSSEMPLDSEPSTRSTSRRWSHSVALEETRSPYHSSEKESEAESEVSTTSSRPRLSGNKDAARASDEMDREYEDAEQLDQQASRRDERQLYESLGQTAPASLDPDMKDEDEGETISLRRIRRRKPIEDFVHWRDRTLYRSEWEEYGHEIFDIYDDLSQGRHKRRRLTSYDSAESERESPSEELLGEPDQVAEVDHDDQAEDGDEHHDTEYEAMDLDEPALSPKFPPEQPSDNESDLPPSSPGDPDDSDRPPSPAPSFVLKQRSHIGSTHSSAAGSDLDASDQAPSPTPDPALEEESDLESTPSPAVQSDPDDSDRPVSPALSPGPEQVSDIASNYSSAAESDPDDSDQSPSPKERKRRASRVRAEEDYEDDPPSSSSDGGLSDHPESRAASTPRRSTRLRTV